MGKKFLLMTFLVAIIGFCGTSLSAQVAKVGNTEYATIDEAIAAWTNNTTLTLLADVTLSDVIKLSSTEYHILDLGNYTMTAASKKDAIQIVNNGRSSASYALDVKADATNPGGIIATGKAVVRTAGKSGVKDRPIIRFYNGVFDGSYIVYHSGSNGTNCPQFQFHGGVFNGTIFTNRTLNQFYGGTFNGSLMMSVDSSAYTLIAGGTFKQLSNLYMSALNSGKFTIGSAKGVYDKEVYIDDNGNYVIAATEPAQGIEADVAKTPGTNDYLAYSKVATEGQLGYTDVYTALEKNTSAKVTVYVEELDLKDSKFKGTIVVPEGKDITITNIPKDANGDFTVEVLVGEEARIPSEDGTFTTIVPVEVATYDELVAALANGGVIKLTDDITATGAVDGTDANIDLNGKTLTLSVGGNNFFGDSKVKNGSIKITGCVASGDCIIGIGDYSNSATLTFDNVNVNGNGYSSAYAVLYVYNSSELNINGGSVVVSNDNASAGGVIKAHKAADGKINIVGTEGDPVELTFNNAKIGMLDGTVLMNYVDLDITGGANAINQSALTIKNSTLDITGADGRALTLSQGNVVVENSTLNFSDCSEGEIRFKKSLELTADDNSTIIECTTYADASAKDAKINGVDVDASESSKAFVTVVNGTTTVKEAPKGNNFTGYTRGDAIWGEVWGNAKESFVIKVLDANGNVMGTTSLNNIGGIIDGDVNVTWSLKFDAASNTDEYWTMSWTTAPTIDNMPAKVELWVDGVKVSGGNVVLNGPDNINKIYAAVTDNTGKILAYHTNVQEAIKAAAVTSVARTATAGTVEVLSDVTVDKWVMFAEKMSIGDGSLITLNINGVTIDGNGKTLTVKSIESAGNGGYLFYDAQNLTVKDLTINIADGLVGGIGLQSGTISKVTFNGGKYAVLPGANGVTIDGCTFNGTTGYAVYYEDARPGIVVNNNTFNTADGAYAITMRSNEQFTNNNITKGRVNLANSAASTVSGNDFGTERFKVYNGATATISNNKINNLVFSETNAPAASTFEADNILSAEAQAAIDALPVMAGDGTEANPYTIGNLAQLKAFRDEVNAGNNYQGKFVKLTADIDLNNEEWTPIGNVTYDSKYKPTDASKVFSGVFNGNGKVISNLKVASTVGGVDTQANVGLFGITGEGAAIKDLTLTNVNIETDGRNVGALAGFAYKATLSNITVNGNIQIKGGNNVAGIAGMTRYYAMSATNISVSGANGSAIVGNNIVGGIFAEIAPNGSEQTFKGLNVENVAITGVGGVGGIVGLLTTGTVENVSVKNVVLTGRTDYQGNAMGRIRLGSVAGLLGSKYATIANETVDNVTAKNLDGNAVELPVIGANYDAASNATEAKIGNTYYNTLLTAVNAAKDDETITMLADLNMSEILVLDKAITLDGNGKKLTSTAGRAINVDCEGNVGIKNLTINASGERAINVIQKPAKVTIDNVTATAANYTVNLASSAGAAKVAIANSNLTGLNVVNVGAPGSEITINGGTITCNDQNANENYAALALNKDGKNATIAATNVTFDIKGDSKKAKNGAEGGVITIDGSTDGVDVNVAYISAEGNYYYAYTSIEAAIEAANAGQTIVLIRDVTVAEKITIAKSITLDGNGKTITYTGNGASARAIDVPATEDAELDVTIKNLTVDCNASYCQRGINYNDDGKFTLDGVTVKGTNVTYAVNLPGSADNAEITIKNSDIAGNIALNVWGENSVVNVENTTLTAVDNSAAEGYAAVKLNNDGTTSAEGTVINITGGKIDVTGSAAEDTEAASNGTSTGAINISESTVVNGKIATLVAVIRYAGGNSYSFETLPAAIEFAKAGDVVTLIRDITASDIITINKAITLDGNGKKLTSTAGRAINVSGEAANGVTIKNLTIECSGERAINVIQKATNVTIDNVTATAANYTVNVASSAPNAVVAIKNSTLNGLCTVSVSAAGSQVTVDNSTVNCNDNDTTAGEAYAALSLNKEAVGGSIVATNSTINVTDGSDSMKGRNSAENGTVSINGSTDDVTVMVAVITYEGSPNYYSFETLAAAVEFAKAGETVALLRDITVNKAIEINKSVTIDGNGKTIMSTAAQAFVFKTADVAFNINNATVIAANNAIRIEAAAKNAKVVATETNFAGLSTINVRAENAEVSIDGGKITCNDQTDAETYGALTIAPTGKNAKITATNVTMDIKGDSYEGFNNTEDGVITINGSSENVKQALAIIEYDGGGVYSFLDLDEAIEYGIKDKRTVKILTNATISEKLVINGSVTIDGNGKTLTYTGADRAIDVPANADAKVNVTIKNLTVDCNASYCQRGINYNDDGKFTLDGVTVKGVNVTYAVNLPGSADNAEITIKNSDIAGNIALNVWGENSVINAENTVFTAVDNNKDEGYAAVKLNNDGMTSAEGTVINITGGKIDVTGSAAEDTEAASNGTSTGAINISESTVVNGKIATLVAVIRYAGGNSYSFETLPAAIEFAKAGDVVTLIRDITASDIITINKAITLDGNGKKLTSTAGRAINVSGEAANGVTIKKLTIECSGERAINVIQNATNVTIENVTATAANYTVNVASSAPNAVVAISGSNLTGLNVVNVAAPQANVTINGGTITCNDQNANENYAALALNKDAVGAKIAATGVTFDIKGDSKKAKNGAEDGVITIDGSTDGVAVMVAVITYEGSDYYYSFATLEAAVNAAKAGDVVSLIRDITTSAQININKNVAIDGCDKKLTVNAARGFQITGGTVAISNMTIDMPNAAEGNRGINLYNGDTNAALDVTLNNVTINGGKAYAVNIGGGKDNKLTINGSTLTGYAAINVHTSSVNHTIVVDGSTLNGKNHNNNYDFGTVVVDGTNAHSLTITNTTITTENLEGVTSNYEKVVVGPNCTLVWDGDAAVRNILADSKGGKLYYTDLQAAINDAAEVSGTVQILGNITATKSISIPTGKKITIDLNGKTITGTDNETKSFGLININEGAELTINDAIGNGAIKLTATNDRDWNAYSSVISNQRGKLTVNGGTIEHLGGTDMAYGIDNLTNGKGTYAETIINGGTIKSTYRAIRQFLNGVEAQNILTVNGGTIEGANKSIWMQDPNKNANTGTLAVGEDAKLIGDVYLFVTAGSTSWPVEVSIADAALQGESTVMTGNVPAGYKLELSDGIYGVTYIVATIGDNRYETLQDAIDAAGTAETTINVIANTTENITIQEGANITLEFDEDITLNGYFAPFRGNLTINGGTINNTNSGASAIEINAGELNLNNVNIASARHAVRIDGAVTATINGGEYKLTATSGTRHAVNVSGGAEVTITAGTFVGPKGTTMDSGSAVCVQASSKVTIEGGDFSGGKNATLGVTGSMIVTGGTFDQDPSAYLAQGYITKYNETTSRYEVFKGVAKIENEYFASIQDAIDAAQNNDVIKVLNYIYLSDDKELNTLDGKYNTYFKVEDKTVTIDLNGKIIYVEYSNPNMLVGVFSTENNGRLTLMDSSNGTGSVDVVTKGNGVVYSLIANYESGCSITINGGTYKLDKASDSHIYSGCGCTNEGTQGVTVNGGVFYLGNVATGSNGSPWIFNVKGQNNGHVKVFGGTYNYNVFNQYWIFEAQTSKEYAIRYDGDETWTVVPAVAWVNNQKQSGGNWYTYELGYTTLAEAIAAAEDCNRPDFTETVTLLQDITLENTTITLENTTITVNAGKDVILDLNEFAVSQKQKFTKSYSMITNNGKLTIEGNGRLELEDLSNGGGSTWGTYIINNHGELIVNDATLEHLGTAGDNFSTCIPIQNYQGKVTVNEGAYISSPEFRSLRDFTAGGEIIINGGKFNGQIWMQGLGNGSSSLTIKGGEFGPTANDGSSVFITNGTNVVNVSIEGGLFNTKIGATDPTKEGVAGCITGGVFTTAAKENTNEKLLNENFAFANNDNGTWTVMPAQKQSLVKGWNWYSTYLDIETADLTGALGSNGDQIKNQDGGKTFYVSQRKVWEGSLTLEHDKMYMINVLEACSLQLAADVVDATSYDINLRKGWSWIGYPSNQEIDINTALANFEEPNEGDRIKSQYNGYAEYRWGKWRGTLKTLVPGIGYMYNNKTETVKSFRYNFTPETTSRGAVEANVTAENNYWTPDATKYPFNMTMTAVVDGLADANYEVAAFVNGEVRGSARPIYIEEIDAYVLFLTIHGEDVEEMSFRLYDIDNDTEYDLSDRINYSNNAEVGSLDNPYTFSRGTTGIGEASMSEVNIYPNPTTTGTEINLEATCDKVEVFNALGVKVAEYQNVDTIDALETAGIYVIRITNNGNVQNCRLVVK